MATLINLYRPKGFSDSSKFALNSSTGELLEWEWESLNPEDFSLDKNGNVFHNCNDKKSWSRIVRHGENANNFFEEEINLFGKGFTKSFSCKEVVSQRRRKHAKGQPPNTSYKGRIQLRKKKFKKKKYKNSKMRKQKWPDKRRKEKVFKKAVATREITRSGIPAIERCQYCLVSNEVDNIFNSPQERHRCDFCKKSFDGIRLKGHVCEYCLRVVFRTNFCDDCKQNLGEWTPDWRIKLNIPHHPMRCNCKNCIKIPCFNCEMNCHSYKVCPWRDQWSCLSQHHGRRFAMTVGPGGYPAEYWTDDDYEADRIQEAVRDDYLFGWG